MKFILHLLVTSLSVVITAYFLPGVYIASFSTAVVVAIVLSFLNLFLRPLLILLTIPITMVTFGLFLFIINALLIAFADYLISGFDIRSFGVTILFSIVLSVVTNILTFIAESSK